MSSYSWKRRSNDQFQTQRNKTTNAGRAHSFWFIIYEGVEPECKVISRLSVTAAACRPLETFLQAQSGGFNALSFYFAYTPQSMLQMRKSSHHIKFKLSLEGGIKMNFCVTGLEQQS